MVFWKLEVSFARKHIFVENIISGCVKHSCSMYTNVVFKRNISFLCCEPLGWVWKTLGELWDAKGTQSGHHVILVMSRSIHYLI